MSHIVTLSKCHRPILCHLAESHCYIINMLQSNASSLARVILAHSQVARSLCHVSCQSHIGTLSRCHRSMLCLLAESHWYIIKMSHPNALSLVRVTLAHSQVARSLCPVSWQSHIVKLSDGVRVLRARTRTLSQLHVHAYSPNQLVHSS